MRTIQNIKLILLCFIPFGTSAQLVYHNADAFPLSGKLSDATETRYERLPSALHATARPPVWDLGKNTAGLYIRFRSNSRAIGLKWQLRQNGLMSHMALTGIKGFDLYCLENDDWVYAGTAIPDNATENEAMVIADMDGKDKELMLYFPLYDGVAALEIGVDSASFISPPEVRLPRADAPVVCYGSSILQGGCASRPGMVHTSILSRRLNCEFINLGFSGNALLDYELAELIARSDASVIVLDFVPNSNAERIYERMETFYSLIRSKQPNTPILFIEAPDFPGARYNRHRDDDIVARNKALHEVFDRIKTKGDALVELLSADTAIGHDNEATVDGTHFTDLGFMRYADYLYPYLKKHLAGK
ncbi:SGNH/GDSL hydrolase family protein [Parapedobacter sp. DT-150]|uniref:SGNH/GDSL hydrolase family protein n=1 Tax=Parapedobacter sp. DT-150 TaxID=3396162 RepID=UPI003F1A409E